MRFRMHRVIVYRLTAHLPYTMHLTLKQLAVFRAAYETRRLSEAARRLHLSLSTVSQSLRELESTLGTPLFTRDNTGLMPTAAALTLIPYANLIIEKTLEAESLFSNIQSGRAGRLTIGSNRRFGIYVMSRRLMQFQRKMPAVETTLLIDDNTAIEEAVINRQIDIGFISGRPKSTALGSFACAVDRLAVVVGLGSPYINVYATPMELAKATWVLEQEPRAELEARRLLEHLGIQPTQVITMNTMGAVKRAVGTGLGIAVIPHLAAREEILRGELVEILKTRPSDAQTSDHIYAIWHDDVPEGLRDAFFKACDLEPID